MVSVTANTSLFDFSNITADISKSVSNIKFKQDNLPSSFSLNDTKNTVADFQSFSLNNYAVSYLEPNSLFAVQKMASEISDSEKMSKHQKQEQVSDEQQKQVENQNSEKTDDASKISFMDELFSYASGADNLTGIAAYNYLNTPVSEIKAFNNDNAGSFDFQYISGIYNFVANINSKPDVLIDFMHEFNRNYDYTI